MRKVPLMMIALAILASLYAFALAGCGLTAVQKLKLSCAESAEQLASAYRAAKSVDELRALDGKTAARAEKCNESAYRAVEGK